MKCRICDSQDLELTIDLGKQPWGNNFLKNHEVGQEVFYPLEVVFCNNCSCSQLNFTVPKEIMFADHTYLSGMTSTLDRHFLQMAKRVKAKFFEQCSGKRVLDIGSNDGTQLKHYKDLGFDVQGIESSSNIVEIANENGINTDHGFFNEDYANKCHSKFDVINASGIFFHLEELHSVTSGIKRLLKEKGVFVVQFIYLKNMIENYAFDQIYHEHLLYYNFKPLNTLLKMHGLEIFDAELNAIHGGSAIAYVAHEGSREIDENLYILLKEEEDKRMHSVETYKNFANDLIKVKEKNLEYLQKCKAEDKRVIGMGAPVKGNTLLNYFGIDNQLLECLVEINPLRAGLFSPGSHLQVKMENDIDIPPDVYYVLAWNFKKEILENNKNLINSGTDFYFPVNVD